ncbi:hypothetical protein LY78DRAFT_210598 [Colletotrichum sublineola]|nr:hypothetical protein LY78DRAFT_210598 [Colletotrichum sublineola]
MFANNQIGRCPRPPIPTRSVPCLVCFPSPITRKRERATRKQRSRPPPSMVRKRRDVNIGKEKGKAKQNKTKQDHQYIPQPQAVPPSPPIHAVAKDHHTWPQTPGVFFTRDALPCAFLMRESKEALMRRTRSSPPRQMLFASCRHKIPSENANNTDCQPG